jgi:ATP adenylyltransferase
MDAPAADDRHNLVVCRGPGAVALLNLYPYNPGHLLVAPAAHLGDLAGLDDRATLELMGLVRRSLRVIERLMAPQGFNLGINQGAAAGAGIPDHVHFHLVPRWNGDTNFMPVLGEVKVVNEHLERTWERLVAAFAE